jgi:hypothetical protein
MCVTTEETPSPMRQNICQAIVDSLSPFVLSARCPRAFRKAAASVEKTARFRAAAILINIRING